MRDFREILEAAIEEHQPVQRYVLCSGGNDSTNLLHRVWSAGLCDAAVHINTGIGIEETREFVRKFCASMGIPLIEKHPPKGVTYESLVVKHGFPGPGAHRYMYIMLKQRAIEELVREAKTNWFDRVLLITGVRSSESQRRMGHVEAVRRIGAQVWVAPLIDYTKTDLIEYRVANNVPENEVSALLHMSGECLCGAFAQPDEIRDLETFFPQTAARIHEIERKVALAGNKHCVWGLQAANGRSRRMRPVGELCHDCVDTSQSESIERSIQARGKRALKKLCWCGSECTNGANEHPSCAVERLKNQVDVDTTSR